MVIIKTIVNFDLDDYMIFDQRVNEALLDGWTLTKRERVDTPESPSRYGYLYAEMEREVVAPHEHNCSTCLYSDQDGGEPCDSCDEETWNKWEPQEGAIVMVPLTKR